MDDKSISKYTLESILLHFSKIIKSLIITLVIVLTLWFTTIGLFVWYVSLPSEEVTSSEQEVSDIHDSEISQSIGE